MNIFVLHNHPRIAARMQCDRHVVKMTLETAQLLSTAVNQLGGQGPYKSTHVNHPCSVWARESLGNFLWLYTHGLSLAREYTRRYKKVHKSQAVIEACLDALDGLPLFDGDRTPHPLCMPDEYKSDDVTKAYRAFYIGEKAGFAQWRLAAPYWWPQQTGGE